MGRTITVSELVESRFVDQFQLIDVRSVTEFRAEHIPGAVNLPMNELEARTADLDPKQPLLLVCQAGTRARMCATRLANCHKDITVLEGGTDAWKKAGLPLVTTSRVRWSLERQVRLGAGLLVLAGVLLGILLNSRFLAISAFVGLGLTFAGFTDICPMGILLGRMPWNGTRSCSTAGARADKAQCC